ncbi:HNH endonuclease [Novosphingobium fuchskuhlense]
MPDHVVPHSKGGKTTIANRQAACPACNLANSGKTRAPLSAAILSHAN